MITSDNIKIIYILLLGYSIGFIFQATRIIYAKALYAFKNTKAPLINGIISIAINIFLSILLTKFFGYIGISLSTSISMFFATILLHFSLKKHIPDISYKENIHEFIKMFFAGFLSLILLLLFDIIISKYVTNNFIIILIQCFLCIVPYILFLYISKSQVLLDFINFIKSCLKLKKV